MKLLIVEDDKNIYEFLKMAFERESFAIDVADTGNKALYLIGTTEYDLVILDYMLPKIDGKQICVQLRSEGHEVPIIMLTVQSELKTKVDLLSIGADDYVTKPFQFEELLARVRAILKRPRKIESNTLCLDNLVVNAKEHTVIRDSKNINLTRKEFAVLEYLLRHVNEVVSKTVIIEHVWDMEANPFSNTIETHVSNLRRKIDKNFDKKLIHTIPGIGYKICNP